MAAPILLSDIPDFETTPVNIEFIGTIPAQASAAGVLFSLDVLPYFSNGSLPTSYTLQNAPGWISIDTAGVLSGTPTGAEVSVGVTVTGINPTGSAVSNAFDITITVVNKVLFIGCQGKV